MPMCEDRGPIDRPSASDPEGFGARDSVVHPQCLAPSESERDMAEADAWFVFGVDKVVNELEVHA